MSDIVPSLEEFKSDIELQLGYPLTDSVAEAVEDFWKNWSLFDSIIAEHLLSIKVDVPSLAESRPDFSHYLWWSGAGTAGVIIGLVMVWFFGQAGIALIVLGLCLHVYGNRVRLKDVKRFAEELIQVVVQNRAGGGYAKLCSHYISGIVHLTSPAGSAYWPQHPSNAVTGKRSFI